MNSTNYMNSINSPVGATLPYIQRILTVFWPKA